MTTAQLRNAARNAADQLNWAEAARLMDDAIAAHPERNSKSALARLDMQRMQASADSWRAMA